MAKAIVRTEVWNTANGKIVKAVTRDEYGRILGATNQTSGVVIKRTSRPRVTLVGSK